jgi:predicted lysophospholipase L1 biosynthesis ABC-type transport system permease subunit
VTGESDRPGSEADLEKVEAARKVMERAIWRLNILEYVILAGALLMAFVGGALVAWVLRAAWDLPLRLTWAVSSLLLFIVPGGSVYLRELRRGTRSPTPDSKSEPKDPNG